MSPAPESEGAGVVVEQDRPLGPGLPAGVAFEAVTVSEMNAGGLDDAN
jgi:hypothetical protein